MPTNRRVALSYEALLPRLPELLEHPERFSPLFADEEAQLDASRRLFERGEVVIEERAELDLAIVRVVGPVPAAAFSFGHRASLPIHPMALHSATERSRILLVAGKRLTYHDRYESWVRYCSRPVARRRDLVPLAERLNAEEPGGARWNADSAGALVAVLDHDGESSLTPERMIELTVAHLTTAPVAWDPFSPPPAAGGTRDQWTGSFQRGNQWSRSASMTRSLASSTFRRSSLGLSRRSGPVGTKG